MPRKLYAAINFEQDNGLTKTDLEILVVRAVLDRLGLGPFEAYSSDRPDVLVVLGREQNAVRIGCEVQTLHADSTAYLRHTVGQIFRGRLDCFPLAFGSLRWIPTEARSERPSRICARVLEWV